MRDITVPRAAENSHTYKRIKKLFFTLLFDLKSTAIPAPAPAQSPAASAPNDITPSVKSPANITLTAQLGTSPISAAISGCRTETDSSAYSIRDCPMSATAILNTNTVSRIKLIVEPVLRSEFLIIPLFESQ